MMHSKILSLQHISACKHRTLTATPILQSEKENNFKQHCDTFLYSVSEIFNNELTYGVFVEFVELPFLFSSSHFH